MIQLIRNHSILFTQQRFEQSPVGIEAGTVQNCVVRLQKAADFLLQSPVNGLRSADETHGRHAISPPIQSRVGGLQNGRMIGKTEVVVRTQIDHFTAVRKTNVCVLRRINGPFRLEQPLAANRFQFRNRIFCQSGHDFLP